MGTKKNPDRKRPLKSMRITECETIVDLAVSSMQQSGYVIDGQSLVEELYNQYNMRHRFLKPQIKLDLDDKIEGLFDDPEKIEVKGE